MNQKHLPTIFSLCFVLFLDGLGQGIMLPVFAETLTSRETHVLLVNSPDWVKQLYYGLTMGLFFLFWFFGAAFLGDLSDRIGRKKALIFCLFGLFIGNMVTGLAFTLREPWILLAGRIIAGISSGDQPIAQAAIIDNMPKHKLAQGLGWVLCSLCLGIIVGPIIGYVLSEQRFVAWFVPSTPFYFTSFLILINICVMQFYFHETVQVSEKRRFSLIRSFQVFAEAFKYPVIKILSLCFLLGQMAWSVYLLFTPEFIVQVLNRGEEQVTYFTLLTGIGLSIGFILVVPFVQRRFNPKYIYALGILLLGVTSLFTGVLEESLFIWITACIAGIFFSTAYTYLIALFSVQVSADKQGWVMGITSSLMALSTGAGILIATGIAMLSPVIVYIYTFILALISAVIILNKKIQITPVD